MSCLSVFAENSLPFYVCANPIFVTSESDYGVTFEVFADDATSLKSRLGKLHLYHSDSKLFWAELTALQPCESTHPALRLLRHRPTLQGVLTIRRDTTIESSHRIQAKRIVSPVTLFYVYSHKDERLRDELETHLSPLKRQGLIGEWHDRRISAGREWERQVDENIESSHIILLLISADFLASDYCYDREMKRALEKHDANDARVIPVILRAVDWHGAPFSKLQALPKDAKPVTLWPDKDEAWTDVAKGIRKAAEELRVKLGVLTDSANAPRPGGFDTALGTTNRNQPKGKLTTAPAEQIIAADPRIHVDVFLENDHGMTPCTGLVLKLIGNEPAYKIRIGALSIGARSVRFDPVPSLVAGIPTQPIYPHITGNISLLRQHDLSGVMMEQWKDLNQEEIVFPAYANYEDYNGRRKYRVDWDFKLFPMSYRIKRQRKVQQAFMPDTRGPYLVVDNLRYTQLLDQRAKQPKFTHAHGPQLHDLLKEARETKGPGRGKVLERLALQVFLTIKGLQVIRTNARLEAEELDVYLQNNIGQGFWKIAGSPIIVECKNWSEKVGAAVIGSLFDKLKSIGPDAKTAILVAPAGVTADALLKIREKRQHGLYILTLDDADLEEIANGTHAAQVIERKYHALLLI